jgi:hypothetical protein
MNKNRRMLSTVLLLIDQKILNNKNALCIPFISSYMSYVGLNPTKLSIIPTSPPPSILFLFPSFSMYYVSLQPKTTITFAVESLDSKDSHLASEVSETLPPHPHKFHPENPLPHSSHPPHLLPFHVPLAS